MKIRFVMLAVASMLVMGAMAQETPEGNSWWGKLSVNGAELTLVFHMEGDSCTLDSPDQGVRGIPAKLETTAVGIRITVPAINALYEGVYYQEALMGTFTQQGMAFPLTLRKGEQKLNRPQTPVAPFPYQTEEVAFSNGAAVLKGTLTMPEGCSRNTPVLLMVTGSGPQTRDEEVFEHKPFAVIADALARQGIATLRYDDRGVGQSTGDVVNCTTEDFKNDALAGIRLLRSRFDKVGVIGHSEGGTIALMLAAEKKADFIVTLAAMAVSGRETLLWQNRLALAAAGVPTETVDTYCKALDEVFDSIIKGTAMPPTDKYDLPAALAQNLTAAATQLRTPYLKHFLTLDCRQLLGSIACPVLALNGTKDMQVECERNIGALRSGLPQSPKNRCEAVEGLNHLFQHCNTGMATEYRDIEETIAPEVLETIVRTINNNQ